MQYINELREGEVIREIYLCKQLQTLKTKLGKSYYSLVLQDRTGTLDAKVWELNSGIDNFDAMDYIQVEGQLTSFQGALQLNVKRIRKSREGEYNPEDYMPCSEYDITGMYKELMALGAEVKQPQLYALIESFFVKDKEFIAEFKKHSAAKAVHHGFMGGLLEHTLSVTKLCAVFAAHYPILNRDLLITAAMFHDIGKIDELSGFPENDYTDEGNLVGHIVTGTEMIGERIRMIDKFPKTLAAELKHCILAHHGELEFGSPKKPALAEAMALHFADNLDAKLQTMKELFNGSDGKSDWMGYQRLFESNIRKTTI